MRKHKIIKVDDIEITVRELRVQDIMDLFGGGQTEATGMMDHIARYLPRFVDGIDMEGLKLMSPSEIKQIYDVFKEVNAVFFEWAQSLGLSTVINQIRDQIRNEFSKVLADSLNQVTPMSLNTDTAIS